METRQRPLGISILGVLHIAGGTIGCIAIPFLTGLLLRNPEAQEALSSFGIPPALLVVSIVILFVLTVASGVGMWRGTRWGWYLGSFYYIYSIVHNAVALYTISTIINSLSPEQLAEMTRGPGFYYLKHGARVIIHSLLYLYFFKRNVREYFGLLDRRLWIPIVIQISLCALITTVFSLLALNMD